MNHEQLPNAGRVTAKWGGWNGAIALAMAALIWQAVSRAQAAEEGGPAGVDVVVYGGTAGGVAAAVQAARLGKSTLLVEPTDRLGGLSSGGLGQTDIGNKRAIGGVSREFYQRVRIHYNRPEAWRWQARESYRSEGQSRTESTEDTMWTFEPSVARRILEEMVREHHVRVLYGERLDLNGGVAMTRARPWRIESIRMESGRVIRGRMFIDATYEGDLMAKAKVSYTVGREANADYGETLNGVQTRMATKHQLVAGVDPYRVKGDRSSGLLPGLDPSGPGAEGAGDRRVQAYCFRMCLTDHPENRRPIVKPAGYDEGQYELLFRNFEAGFDQVPWHNASMPNRKTDINNNMGFSTDYIGQNYGYPEGDYTVRAGIVSRHLTYQQGLLWTLAHHPRVPEKVRAEVSRWGPCRDEFESGDGWQAQLYIREARRMVGAHVMTQHECQGRRVVGDPVGLAAYTMDSHHVQRHVDAAGHARNEGDVQVGGFPPYPISYRSLVPKEEECSNLLVPVCLSATHIAFGSIRMEPVFMVLGQSAATAAALALDAGVPVQQVDYAALRARLLADRQVLEWTGGGGGQSAGLDPRTLEGTVVDNTGAEWDGDWAVSVSTPGWVGAGYLHDNNEGKGTKSVRYSFVPGRTGRYEVRVSYTAHPNRATNVPVTIRAAAGVETARVNQRKAPSVGKAFVSVGVFEFGAGQPAAVEIGTAGTDGYVIADAVQWIPVP